MIEDAGLMNEDERFADNVRREREKRGWKQSDVAEKLRSQGFDNFHPTTVSRIEKGDRAVKLSEAAGFAKVFEMTVGELVRDYVEEIDLLSEGLATMRELESRIVNAYSMYEGCRLALQGEVKVFDEWAAEHPDVVADHADVIKALRTSADQLMRQSAWKVLDAYELSMHPEPEVEGDGE